jgi:hypothetical protein
MEGHGLKDNGAKPFDFLKIVITLGMPKGAGSHGHGILESDITNFDG